MIEDLGRRHQFIGLRLLYEPMQALLNSFRRSNNRVSERMTGTRLLGSKAEQVWPVNGRG